MKKGTMIFPVLVSAIIALVVLVMIISIMGGKVSWFNQNTNTCEGQGGKCSEKGECNGPAIYTGDCTYYKKTATGNEAVEGRMGQCCLN